MPDSLSKLVAGFRHDDDCCTRFPTGTRCTPPLCKDGFCASCQLCALLRWRDEWAAQVDGDVYQADITGRQAERYRFKRDFLGVEEPDGTNS